MGDGGRERAPPATNIEQTLQQKYSEIRIIGLKGATLLPGALIGCDVEGRDVAAGCIDQGLCLSPSLPSPPLLQWDDIKAIDLTARQSSLAADVVSPPRVQVDTSVLSGML